MQIDYTVDQMADAIETVLQELENSIPKKKIEDKIKELEHLIEEVKDVVGLGFDCIEYKGAIQVLQELLEDK